MKMKLDNKGTIFYFEGYSLNHTGDVFRMYNHRTGKISITRDLKWLNKMAHEVKKKDNCIEDEIEYEQTILSEDEIDDEI